VAPKPEPAVELQRATQLAEPTKRAAVGFGLAARAQPARKRQKKAAAKVKGISSAAEAIFSNASVQVEEKQMRRIVPIDYTEEERSAGLTHIQRAKEAVSKLNAQKAREVASSVNWDAVDALRAVRYC
jgi:hypothetical protein|tara:strand:+ start:144 stop:527 length:384 start_codon:yes stop_codon:yes gene_type:complete